MDLENMYQYNYPSHLSFTHISFPFIYSTSLSVDQITPIPTIHTPQSTIHLSQSHPNTPPTLIPDTPMNTAQSSPGRLYKRSRLWQRCSDTNDTILASPVPPMPPPPQLSRLLVSVSMCVFVCRPPAPPTVVAWRVLCRAIGVTIWMLQ